MQVAAHTYCFRDWPLGNALDAIKALGFEHVELWQGHAPRGGRFAAQALARRGLDAVAVGAGGFYSADARAVDAAVELARAVDAPAVVACVAPGHAAAIAARLPHGRVLCVENHWYQELARPRDVARVLADVPGFAACLDTGHALLAGIRPERFATKLGSRLRHVHLKEARRASHAERALGRRARRRLLPAPEPVFPGEGALDVEALVEAVRGLPGPVTLSLEYEGARPEAALARLREAVG